MQHWPRCAQASRVLLQTECHPDLLAQCSTGVADKKKDQIIASYLRKKITVTGASSRKDYMPFVTQARGSEDSEPTET
jgi:hypothetical protein